MRMRHLHYFLIVAEELSFTRAAARVHIEPSPLSRAIKTLECQLGVSLFHRTHGRIQLTWPGEVFREEARRMIDLMSDAQTRVNSASQGYQGRLRIGLTDHLAQPKLAQLLAQCREEEPDTEIILSEMSLNTMLQALNHNQVDLGFTLDNIAIDGYIKQKIWADCPVVAVPACHPLLSFSKIPLAEILRYAVILFHPEQCAGGYNIIRSWFDNHSLSIPETARYVSGHESMMLLVGAGYGIGIGLRSQVELYNYPNIIIRPLVDDTLTMATCIVLPEKPVSAELARFITRAQQMGDL